MHCTECMDILLDSSQPQRRIHTVLYLQVPDNEDAEQPLELFSAYKEFAEVF